jgi:crossover junction endodeoxyribonuclease RuvC
MTTVNRTIHHPDEHTPIEDDGVTYCGWAADGGIYHGCGVLWTPGHDVAAKQDTGRSGAIKVVGLDLSLTSTGVAVATQDGAITDRIISKPTPKATLADRAVRIGLITARVVDFVRGADLVVIESPTYATSTGSQHDRSGLWWLVVNRLIAGTMPVVEISPTTRCRYATGRGNASKDDVLSAVIRRYPHVDVNGNDEADSLVLAAMGARHLGHPLETATGGVLPREMPRTHLAAMDAVAWPNPDRAA